MMYFVHNSLKSLYIIKNDKTGFLCCLSNREGCVLNDMFK